MRVEKDGGGTHDSGPGIEVVREGVEAFPEHTDCFLDFVPAAGHSGQEAIGSAAGRARERREAEKEVGGGKRSVFDVRGGIGGRRERAATRVLRRGRGEGWEARNGRESGEESSSDLTMNGGAPLQEGGHFGKESRGSDELMDEAENDLIW